MIEDFKCSVCGSTEVHRRTMKDVNGEGVIVDWLMDIRNPRLNSRIIIRMCKTCNVLMGAEETFKDSKWIAQEDKDVAAHVLGEKEIEGKELTEEGLAKEITE